MVLQQQSQPASTSGASAEPKAGVPQEVNIQEADALGVNLGSFGETFTAEEAAELLSDHADAPSAGEAGSSINGETSGDGSLGLKGGSMILYSDKSRFTWFNPWLKLKGGKCVLQHNNFYPILNLTIRSFPHILVRR